MVRARDLGYIGSEKCCAAVAQELRTPRILVVGAYVSLRVMLIDALRMAFPEEPLLWPRDPVPVDDSYYEKIEKWAEARFQIGWDRPRPKFFYAEPREGPPHRSLMSEAER